MMVWLFASDMPRLELCICFGANPLAAGQVYHLTYLRHVRRLAVSASNYGRADKLRVPRRDVRGADIIRFGEKRRARPKGRGHVDASR